MKISIRIYRSVIIRIRYINICIVLVIVINCNSVLSINKLLQNHFYCYLHCISLYIFTNKKYKNVLLIFYILKRFIQKLVFLKKLVLLDLTCLQSFFSNMLNLSFLYVYFLKVGVVLFVSEYVCKCTMLQLLNRRNFRNKSSCSIIVAEIYHAKARRF